jgi:ABC-type multidrug transport system fused ATPase/permease subunit
MLEINDLADEIRFQGLKFKYPTAPETAKPVFDNVNFRIKTRTSTAIVGPSGSGKSTIVQLLNRYYDPDVGCIYFNKTPLREISLSSLRETVGYVGQEPALIVGTIRENLINGNCDASDAQIREAISQANAEFVYDIEPYGLDTYVGAGSILNLSGG